MRCTHEASQHKRNCFITLTYDDEHLPHRGQLTHKHFQDFLKRLRKQIAPNRVRFYMGGEYGSKNFRPHYHACLFGHDFDDKKYLTTTDAGGKIYTSAKLTSIWGKGYASIGELTFESAAYIARYCLQKVTGEAAEWHYRRWDDEGIYQQEPEYNSMSLKPGIGATWLHKYHSDVYTGDFVIINGKECRAPKYYDKLFDKINPDKLDQIRADRITEAATRWADNTPARLLVKEQVAKAKTKNLLRGKI